MFVALALLMVSRCLAMVTVPYLAVEPVDERDDWSGLIL